MTDRLRCDEAPPEPTHGFTFSLERRIRVPLDDVFAWWTDFDAVDAELSNGSRLVSRTPVRRQDDRIWKQDVNRLGPLRVLTDSVVQLDPPERWTIVAESPLHGVRGRYRLQRDGEGCRLRGTWHVFARRWWLRPVLALSRRRVKADLAREWAGYIRELEREWTPARGAPRATRSVK